MADGPDGVAAEANRLYWSSDLSVAEVAEVLNLSRRALYGLVEPLLAGGECDVCGTPLSFANRSARDAGRAQCEACAAAAEAAEEDDAAALGARIPARQNRSGGGDAAGPDYTRTHDGSLRRRAARLGGLALVGILVGAGVTMLATRD